MDYLETIGFRLKISRENAKISQAKIAEMAGVTDKTIQNYEGNKTPITADIILKYAKYCGVSPNFLLTGESNKEDEKQYKDEQINFYKEQVEFYKQKVKELEEKLKAKK